MLQPKKQTPQQKRATLDSLANVRRADIIRKKDSISQRGLAASNVGREKKQSMEEYKKKSAEKVPYQGVAKADRSPTGDSDKQSGIGQAIRKICTANHCIYSKEDKSGVKKKNGGKITSKKKTK